MAAQFARQGQIDQAAEGLDVFAMTIGTPGIVVKGDDGIIAVLQQLHGRQHDGLHIGGRKQFDDQGPLRHEECIGEAGAVRADYRLGGGEQRYLLAKREILEEHGGKGVALDQTDELRFVDDPPHLAAAVARNVEAPGVRPPLSPPSECRNSLISRG